MRVILCFFISFILVVEKDMEEKICFDQSFMKKKEITKRH